MMRAAMGVWMVFVGERAPWPLPLSGEAQVLQNLELSAFSE